MAAPPLPFWCHICEVDCLSAINLQTHFLDVKHRKLEGAIEEYTLEQEAPEEPNPQGAAPEDDPTPTPPSKPPLNLEEQLDGCRSTEPAIGLEYVEEHQCPGKALKYVCTLCDCEEPTNNMFMHVVGNRHRLAYLTKHYPERSRVPGKGDELNKILRQFAAAVEARDGRKKIRVVIESRPSKRKAEEEDEEANENVFSIGPYVDSSLEDTPVAQGPGALFLELKKAHEESVKERDQERAASIIDIFTSNTELLEYLDNFEVASEDDVVFVLVVNERFTSALTEYQTRCETKTHQELCTAEEPQNVWYKQVPVTQTNSLPLPYNIAACSKPASYNPWIPTPEVFCTNPALYSAAGSIAPPNNIANAIAYHNPAFVPAFPPPNELPNVKYEKPVCYNFTSLPFPPPIPLPLPPPIAVPLPPPIPLLPPPPISYPLPPPISYPLPPPIHFPPPEVPPVVMAEQPVCYNSTSQSSVPQPTPSPIVLSAKPVYYNITNASDSETKTVNEKVVKGPTNRTAVPFKKAKKENPNLAVTGFVFSFN